MRRHCSRLLAATNAQQFARLFLTTLGLLGGANLLVAWVVNPRGYFGSSLFRPVTWDSRQEKMQLFRRYSAAGRVDCLILGSSRSMALAPGLFDAHLGTRCFNFAVQNATVEDYVATFRWVTDGAGAPRLVLLGLDVEALHNDDRPNQNLLRTPELEVHVGSRASRGLGGAGSAVLATLREIMSIGHLWDAIRSARARLRVAIGRSGSLPSSRLDPSGQLHYETWETERRAGLFSLDARIAKDRSRYTLRFADMTALSSGRKAALEDLLRGHTALPGRTAIVWITPLHPKVVTDLERLTPFAQRLADTRTYLEGLRTIPEVHVLDLSAPELFGGDDTGWWDGAHVDDSNATLIVDRLRTAATR